MELVSMSRDCRRQANAAVRESTETARRGRAANAITSAASSGTR